jgi:NAD-dependent deacetylase
MDVLIAETVARIDRVVELFRQSRSLLVITGAGLSADSGLPTYRGVGGLYEDQHAESNIPIEDILSGEMLADRRSKPGSTRSSGPAATPSSTAGTR